MTYLDKLIGLEDALEAIGQHQSLQDFVGCHDEQHKESARTFYMEAANLIGIHGNRHLALHTVQSQICKCR